MRAVLAFGVSDLLGPLFRFLKCLLLWAVGAMAAAVAAVFNLLMVALGAAAEFLLSVLPTMTLQAVQLPPILATANWIFPLDQFVIAVAATFGFLIVWHGLAIALRWMKVVE